jgi:hypothetical protein
VFDGNAVEAIGAFIVAIGGIIAYILRAEGRSAAIDRAAPDPMDSIRADLHAILGRLGRIEQEQNRISSELSGQRERREEMHDKIEQLTETLAQVRISVGILGAKTTGSRRQ